MCFEFFVDERCLKQGEGKGRPSDPWLSPVSGIEAAFAAADVTLCLELAEGSFSSTWKHIHIFSKATICLSPVHFISSWHLSDWDRWKMFPTLDSLSTCQPFNFIVPNLLLIRLQNVSGWLRESDLLWSKLIATCSWGSLPLQHSLSH